MCRAVRDGAAAEGFAFHQVRSAAATGPPVVGIHLPPLCSIALSLALVSVPSNAMPLALSTRLLIAVVISSAVMYRALKKKSVSVSGAISGWVVGFCNFLAGLPFGLSLLTFFYMGTKATTYKQERKKALEEDFKEGT